LSNCPYLIALIFTPIFIFALGILISTFTTAIIIIPCKLKKTINSENLELIKASKKLGFLEKSKGEYTETSLEMVTWFAISDTKEENPEYIRNQTHKRWNAFNAGLNSIIALIIASVVSLLIIFLTEMEFWFSWWWIIWLFLLVIFVVFFLINTCNAYKSVKEIDNIMVKKWLTPEPKNGKEEETEGRY